MPAAASHANQLAMSANQPNGSMTDIAVCPTSSPLTPKP